MLKSRLCDYSDAYILVKGDDAAARLLDQRNKEIIFKNFDPFRKFITEITNTQISDAKDIDIVMLMYNSNEYANNYSKTSESLWPYHRDEPNYDVTNSE